MIKDMVIVNKEDPAFDKDIPETLDTMLTHSPTPPKSRTRGNTDNTVTYLGQFTTSAGDFTGEYQLTFNNSTLDVRVFKERKQIAHETFKVPTNNHLRDESIYLTYAQNLHTIRITPSSADVSYIDAEYTAKGALPEPKIETLPAITPEAAQVPAAKPRKPRMRKPKQPMEKAELPGTQEIQPLEHAVDQTPAFIVGAGYADTEPAPEGPQYVKRQHRFALAETTSYGIDALAKIAAAHGREEEFMAAAQRFAGKEYNTQMKIGGSIAYGMLKRIAGDMDDVALLPADPAMELSYSRARQIATIRGVSPEQFERWIEKNSDAVTMKEIEGKKERYVSPTALNDFLQK